MYCNFKNYNYVTRYFGSILDEDYLFVIDLLFINYIFDWQLKITRYFNYLAIYIMA